MTRAFEKFVSVPAENGTVMVIEKEFGPAGAKDWSQLVSGMVDIVKCTFGTGALYNEKVLKQKCGIYRRNNLIILFTCPLLTEGF